MITWWYHLSFSQSALCVLGVVLVATIIALIVADRRTPRIYIDPEELDRAYRTGYFYIPKQFREKRKL